MTPAFGILLAAVTLNAGTGILVLLANPQRRDNIASFLLGIHIALWIALFMGALSSPDHSMWLRAAMVTLAFLPFSLALLHEAVLGPGRFLSTNIAATLPILAACLPAAAIAAIQNTFRLIPIEAAGIIRATRLGIQSPVAYAYIILLAIPAVIVIGRLLHSLRGSDGIQRTEIQFILSGILSGTAVFWVAVLVGRALPESPSIICGAAAAMTVADAIIAYGLATHRVINFPQFVREVVLYFALISLVTGLYMILTRGLASFGLLLGLNAAREWGHLPAAAGAAAVAVPLHHFLRRRLAGLLAGCGETSIGSMTHKASRILQAITTVPDLLGRFARMITETFGAEHVAVLLRSDDSFVQQYPARPGRYPALQLPLDDILARVLENETNILVRDALERARSSARNQRLLAKLIEIKAAVAVAIISRDTLEGILLLGDRRSRCIYGRNEQDAVLLLCDQLAVALENARLYSAARDSRIRSETLLSHLPAGVIAADENGRITLVNRAAHDLTGLKPGESVGNHVSTLPEPINSLFNDIYHHGRTVLDLDAVLAAGDRRVPVRLSSAVIRDEHDRTRGTLVIFSDQTRIRRLEQQVRRTDRLASVGTLAAGMAHEIKNPLVTIKTFAQLLPERYDDPEFRAEFSELLKQEVNRIDLIVNQLLNFARPTRAELAPHHVHEILDGALRLVEKPVQQKGVSLERRYEAPRDIVHADRNLLDQAFLNFLLNAVQAIEGKGRISVHTAAVTAPPRTSPANIGAPSKPHGEWIRVSIADTGKGIKSEDVSSIFDPFFTTKTNGTGLGLAVAHGIIREHSGSIDVETTPGRGTAFHIYFPLLASEEHQ